MRIEKKELAEKIQIASVKLARKIGFGGIDSYSEERTSYSESDCKERVSYFLTGQPVEAAAKNVLITMAFKKALEKAAKPERIGPFTLKLSTKLFHSDAPIQMEFLNSRNKRIATFGFFVQRGPKGRDLHITNIQGVRRKGISLQALSRALGENWRVWSAKHLKSFAEQKKMGVVGVLPRYFSVIWESPYRYKSAIRQCLQTFRKAGIARIDRSQVSEPPGADWEIGRELRLRERALRGQRMRRNQRRRKGMP